MNPENGKVSRMRTSPGLKGDQANIALLFFLYTLQGIPLGLSAAIPMILQNRNVTYSQQVCITKPPSNKPYRCKRCKYHEGPFTIPPNPWRCIGCI